MLSEVSCRGKRTWLLRPNGTDSFLRVVRSTLSVKVCNLKARSSLGADDKAWLVVRSLGLVLGNRSGSNGGDEGAYLDRKREAQ